MTCPNCERLEQQLNKAREALDYVRVDLGYGRTAVGYANIAADGARIVSIVIQTNVPESPVGERTEFNVGERADLIGGCVELRFEGPDALGALDVFTKTIEECRAALTAPADGRGKRNCTCGEWSEDRLTCHRTNGPCYQWDAPPGSAQAEHALPPDAASGEGCTCDSLMYGNCICTPRWSGPDGG